MGLKRSVLQRQSCIECHCLCRFRRYSYTFIGSQHPRPATFIEQEQRPSIAIWKINLFHGTMHHATRCEAEVCNTQYGLNGKPRGNKGKQSLMCSWKIMLPNYAIQYNLWQSRWNSLDRCWPFINLWERYTTDIKRRYDTLNMPQIQ